VAREEKRVKEIIRWDRGFEPLAKTLHELYWGFTLVCCDCGLKHYIRLENVGLMAYPIRPEGFEYPLCLTCNKFLGMGRLCRGKRIASYEYASCEEYKKKEG